MYNCIYIYTYFCRDKQIYDLLAIDNLAFHAWNCRDQKHILKKKKTPHAQLKLVDVSLVASVCKPVYIVSCTCMYVYIYNILINLINQSIRKISLHFLYSALKLYIKIFRKNAPANAPDPAISPQTLPSKSVPENGGQRTCSDHEGSWV